MEIAFIILLVSCVAGLVMTISEERSEVEGRDIGYSMECRAE